jgi:hypothetical protein
MSQLEGDFVPAIGDKGTAVESEAVYVEGAASPVSHPR